jgi:hypothetical protein
LNLEIKQPEPLEGGGRRPGHVDVDGDARSEVVIRLRIKLADMAEILQVMNVNER